MSSYLIYVDYSKFRFWYRSKIKSFSWQMSLLIPTMRHKLTFDLERPSRLTSSTIYDLLSSLLEYKKVFLQLNIQLVHSTQFTQRSARPCHGQRNWNRNVLLSQTMHVASTWFGVEHDELISININKEKIGISFESIKYFCIIEKASHLDHGVLLRMLMRWRRKSSRENNILSVSVRDEKKNCCT